MSLPIVTKVLTTKVAASFVTLFNFVVVTGLAIYSALTKLF